MRVKYLREESRFVLIDELGFYVKEGPKKLGITTDKDKATRYLSSTEAYNAASEFERSMIRGEGRSAARYEASAIVAGVMLASIVALVLILSVMNYLGDWSWR